MVESHKVMESWPVYEEDEFEADFKDDISQDLEPSEDEQDTNNNLYAKSKGGVVRKQKKA